MNTKICTKCKEEKELTAFGVRKDSKDGLQGLCRKCRAVNGLGWYYKNTEKCKEGVYRWRKNNPEKQKLMYAKYAELHHEVKLARTKSWRSRNKIHNAEVRKVWAINNKPRILAYAKMQKYKRMQRVPKWAIHEIIQIYYFMAAKMTHVMQEAYHVDHIIPLQGELVSGLHVHNNLQVLNAKSNLIKSNKLLTK